MAPVNKMKMNSANPRNELPCNIGSSIWTWMAQKWFPKLNVNCAKLFPGFEREWRKKNTHTNTHTCIYIYIYICIYVCMCYIYTHMCVSVCVWMWNSRGHVHTQMSKCNKHVPCTGADLKPSCLLPWAIVFVCGGFVFIYRCQNVRGISHSPVQN